MEGDAGMEALGIEGGISIEALRMEGNIGMQSDELPILRRGNLYRASLSVAVDGHRIHSTQFQTFDTRYDSLYFNRSRP